MVERLIWVQEAAGSSPVTWTNIPMYSPYQVGRMLTEASTAM